MNKIYSKLDQHRLIKTFTTLVKIDSPSYHEQKIIHYLITTLKKYGLKIKFQKCTAENSGNIIALLKGNKKAPALFFNVHFDTVEPGKGIKPIVTDTLIKSDGTTILAADDKAALAVMLEGIQYLIKNNISHPNIYFILTYAEEQGLVGAKDLDFSLFKAKYGFSFDAGGGCGTACISTPTHYMYSLTVKGKSAHAGVEPEKGINAIKAGAALINKIKTGKLDQETTANIGKINGGIAENIVPENVTINGEVRSRNKLKIKQYLANLKKSIESIKKSHEVKINLQINKAYNAYSFTQKDFLVKKFINACRQVEIKPNFSKSNGGSDSNIFNQKKLQCLNLGIGMQKVHSTKEFIFIKDLSNTLKLFLSIIINW